MMKTGLLPPSHVNGLARQVMLRGLAEVPSFSVPRDSVHKSAMAHRPEGFDRRELFEGA